MISDKETIKNPTSQTWDKVFKKPEHYLNYILIFAYAQEIKEEVIYSYVMHHVGVNLVSAKTEKARKFFEDTARLIV